MWAAFLLWAAYAAASLVLLLFLNRDVRAVGAVFVVVAVAALFGAILTFTDMTVVYVLTRGGPTNSTQVLASWAFIRGIEGGDVAQGAVAALFLFPLLLAAAIAILRAVRRMEVL